MLTYVKSTFSTQILLNRGFLTQYQRKKQKKVKFSGINQIYLIHTNDEIKEYLPDMYWKFDKPEKPQFLPLERKEFVFELNLSRESKKESNKIKISKSTPIPIPMPNISSSYPIYTKDRRSSTEFFKEIKPNSLPFFSMN